MCSVCCKEFKGWCKAFTAYEVLLSILQAVLLVLFIAFLTFLILHLIGCSEHEAYGKRGVDIDNMKDERLITTTTTITGPVLSSTTKHSTLAPDVECTWTPSEKTTSVTQYFEYTGNLKNITISTKKPEVLQTSVTKNVISDDEEISFYESDGELVDDYKRSITLALVKLKPPVDVAFGCILTIVSEYWTLTAASCIESIEEVDSLDSFVMMENFGQLRQGRIHAVSDVIIQPQYQGTNRTYDLAALKSAHKLVSGNNLPKLPTLIDYFLITIGERLTILGFGKFRSLDNEPLARSLREVSVHALPAEQCPVAGEGALRHLVAGVALRPAACAPAPLCAGALHSRGSPCNYCSGTPLLYGDVLLGIMSDNDQCGVTCEPALYVNLVLLRDWVHNVVHGE